MCASPVSIVVNAKSSSIGLKVARAPLRPQAERELRPFAAAAENRVMELEKI